MLFPAVSAWKNPWHPHPQPGHPIRLGQFHLHPRCQPIPGGFDLQTLEELGGAGGHAVPPAGPSMHQLRSHGPEEVEPHQSFGWEGASTNSVFGVQKLEILLALYTGTLSLCQKFAIENGHVSWIHPLNMVIFHGSVTLPQGILCFAG